ncbi:hypothetical protein TPR58_14190 [Sphingomonas sp. HF-S3]|uniref:Transmembrane protein n=1 Tax=Sphingomonas rustica TaxID=3103142 RepID=A0ABV0BBR5_9SPHN
MHHRLDVSVVTLLFISAVSGLILNVRPISAMAIPLWLGLGITILLFAGVFGVDFRVKHSGILGWCGIALLLIVGILSASPLEDDVHRWAREGVATPVIASRMAIYGKIIAIITISVSWTLLFRRLIAERK